MRKSHDCRQRRCCFRSFLRFSFTWRRLPWCDGECLPRWKNEYVTSKFPRRNRRSMAKNVSRRAKTFHFQIKNLAEFQFAVGRCSPRRNFRISWFLSSRSFDAIIPSHYFLCLRSQKAISNNNDDIGMLLLASGRREIWRSSVKIEQKRRKCWENLHLSFLLFGIDCERRLAGNNECKLLNERSKSKERKCNLIFT